MNDCDRCAKLQAMLDAANAREELQFKVIGNLRGELNVAHQENARLSADLESLGAELDRMRSELL